MRNQLALHSSPMEFTGLHHITMITGDAQENARFYGNLLGLRLVKKTVNFDQPRGLPPLLRGRDRVRPARSSRGSSSPGRPRAAPARDRSTRCSSRWPTRRRSTSGSERLARTRRPGSRACCASRTTTGCKLELLISDLGNAPLTGRSTPRSRASTRSRGLHGARAYAVFHGVEDSILTELLGFTSEGDGEYCSAAPTEVPLRLRRAAPPTTSRAPAASTTSRGPRPTRITWSGRSASANAGGS